MSLRRYPIALSFLALAALLAALFAAAHAAGLREHTTILSGTLPPGVDAETAHSGAGAYLLAWFGWVLGTPILVLSAGCAALLERRLAAGERSARSQPQG